MRSFAVPGLAVIFPVNGVADIMAFVLYSPVLPDVQVYIRGSQFAGLPAGEYEGVLLADPVTGYLEYLASDQGNPSGMREVISSAPVIQQDHFLTRPRLCSSMMSCGAPPSNGRTASNTALCRVGWFPLTVTK